MALDFLHNIAALDAVDVHFGRFLAQTANPQTPNTYLAVAAALAHHAISLGDICCDLRDYAATALTDKDGQAAFECPPYANWQMELIQSNAVGTETDERPLIMDSAGFLYLYQYYKYQEKIQQFIFKFNSIALDKYVFEIAAVLRRLFNAGQYQLNFNEPVQRQMLAALNCAVNPFCVISGGPGTGKTTTVAKILALLLELKLVQPSRILLAAPTGKAAARLSESLARAKAEFRTLKDASKLISENVINAIPEETYTIHRLFSLIPQVGAPKAFKEDLKLPADLVVVDEASMADIALLNRLLGVLPPGCRLILVGDHAQLASVGAGSVLSDICGDISRDNVFSASYASMLQTVFSGDYKAISQLPPRVVLQQPRDSLVFLTKNYRFKDTEHGLNTLLPLIRQGAAQEALAAFNKPSHNALTFKGDIAPKNIIARLTPLALKYYAPVFTAPNPSAALDLFERFRILCAVKEGPFGAQNLNAVCEYILRKAGLITGFEGYYHGKPLIVGKNDYRLHLFNGDIGVVWRHAHDKTLQVYFKDYQNGGLRAFNYYNIPSHETAYAMTVHRSQGSEFEHVLVVLPDKDNQILTRELVYTGVSRAKQAVEIWSGADLFIKTVSRLMRRKSGLRAYLENES